MTEVDTATIQSQRDITVGNSPSAIAVSAPDSLWVTNFEDDTVTRIASRAVDRRRRSLEVPVGDGPVDVTFGEGSIWVVDEPRPEADADRPGVGRREATIELGNEPQRVAAGEGGVWVTVRAAETETESETEDG